MREKNNMNKETTIILTGRAYTELREKIALNQSVDFSIGTEDDSQMVKVTEAYTESDPDFLADRQNFPKIDSDAEIRVRIKYQE